MPSHSLSVKPVASVKEALQLVDAFNGKPEDFQLAIPEELLDAVGINIAIITDRILGRGWQPDKVALGPGYKLFRFKVLS